MKSNIDIAFKELQSFIAAYKLDSLSSNNYLQNDLKSFFKRYYAILTWNAQIENSKPWHDNLLKSKQFKMYFSETTSDICQSQLLSYQGLYKPSFLILRSGIENFFRCIGIAYDQNILALKAVRELINVVKEVPDIKQNKLLRQNVDLLHDKYVILCRHVHTADAAHMALTEVVGVFPRYINNASKDFFKIVKAVIVSICSLNCFILQNEFDKMHHSHRDVLFDILPRNVRMSLSLE